MVKVAPSISAGNVGGVWPLAAAAAAALAALNVKVAWASDIPPYVTVVDTPAGSCATTGGCMPPAIAAASAALVVAWRCGSLVQVTVPYSASGDRAWMSATVIGTVFTVVG